MRRIAVAFVLSAMSFHATAWGPNAHRIVAELADQRIAAGTRAETRRLLATSGHTTLAEIANWADEVRGDPNQRSLGKATSRQHFINFADAQCRYDAGRVCAQGQCVVAAIDRNAGILGDRSRSDVERAQALRFLVHFVADAHQPLHAGYRDDRGGNEYQIQFDGKGTNLHAIWDSPVLASRRLGWREHAEQLRLRPSDKAAGTPRQWAEESCRITRDGGIYPRGHRIDRRYLESMRPVAERRLRQAAMRLAMLLDRELGR